MNRRTFFSSILPAAAAPAVPTPQPEQAVLEASPNCPRCGMACW